jgi:proline iminopeptidase
LERSSAPSKAHRIRGLLAAIEHTSTTPRAVSQTGRISVLFVAILSSRSQWVIAASRACICAALSLNGIPGALIHGRFDISGPLSTAWQLHKRWTTTRLHILDDAGHGGGNEFMPSI